MQITAELLQDHVGDLEQQLAQEQQKVVDGQANCYRLEGALQLLGLLKKEVETPDEPVALDELAEKLGAESAEFVPKESEDD